MGVYQNLRCNVHIHKYYLGASATSISSFVCQLIYGFKLPLNFIPVKCYAKNGQWWIH